MTPPPDIGPLVGDGKSGRNGSLVSERPAAFGNSPYSLVRVDAVLLGEQIQVPGNGR